MSEYLILFYLFIYFFGYDIIDMLYSSTLQNLLGGKPVLNWPIHNFYLSILRSGGQSYARTCAGKIVENSQI
jgi:hypothetical protein